MLPNSINNTAFSALLLALWPLLSQAAEPPRSFYVESGSYSTQRETDPPTYVKNVGKAEKNALSWLDAGLEYRLRYEYRDDDLRRSDPTDTNEPLLQRIRLFAAVHDVLDPLRFAVELSDSREFNSHFASDNRDVDHLDLLQGYAELHFNSLFDSDPRGNARPLVIRAGRMAFEALDRRLIARNEWRNTTNAFDGVRVQLGADDNNWALEAWSLHPVTRLLADTDKSNLDQRFDAVIAHIRTWSPALTLEPHYFHLQQDASLATAFRERNILAPGLRVYGRLFGAAVNYDISAMKQHGSDGGQAVDAEGFTAEIGYSWAKLPWKPRLSAFYGYASGDTNPNDQVSERFDRFFGFARPWSADDYFIYENIHAPKLRLEFQPLNGVRVDVGYNWYRLASDTDRASNLLAGSSFNRDRTGRSGAELGENWDLRVRFPVVPHVQANLGYSSFHHGDFTRARQLAASGDTANDSDFFYVELTWRLFE